MMGVWVDIRENDLDVYGSDINVMVARHFLFTLVLGI
jgi:hypothetical protein